MEENINTYIDQIKNKKTDYSFSLGRYREWAIDKFNQCTYKCGIYIIENITSNKWYLGSTKHFKKRIAEHFNMLENNIHPNKRLQNSYNKHSNQSFYVYLFPINLSRKELFDLEALCIQNFNLVRIGYNDVVDSRCHGYTAEERIEIGRRLSKANKGVPKSLDHRKKCGISISITNRGSGNPRSKLTKEAILFIRTNFDKYYIEEFMKMFNVKRNTIRSIIHLRSYNYNEYIPENYVVPSLIKRKPKFSKEDIKDIKSKIEQHLSLTDISKLYHCSRKTISNIKTGKYYAES